jgi:hypothetical protein
MLKLKWCDDLKAESDFRAMNIPFTKAEIRFSKIDLRESHFNGARLGDPVIPDLIRDYAQGMRNGDTFPRPVAVIREQKTYKEVISKSSISAASRPTGVAANPLGKLS